MWKQTKTNQMLVYVFRVGDSKGVGHHHVGLAEARRQAEERGNYSRKRGDSGACGWEVVSLGKL